MSLLFTTFLDAFFPHKITENSQLFVDDQL